MKVSKSIPNSILEVEAFVRTALSKAVPIAKQFLAQY